MRTENSILMENARKSLQGNWGNAAAGTAVFTGLNLLINSFLPGIGFFLVTPTVLFGYILFTLSISRGKDAQLEQILKGFNNFIRFALAGLLIRLFIFLWSLLFIIPGIVASYSYSMAFYIMADDDSVSASEAIAKSKIMMRGNKWKLFYLHCRFIGWAILAWLFSFGIGFLWLSPYIRVSTAKFYDDLKCSSKEENMTSDNFKNIVSDGGCEDYSQDFTGSQG
ncbi:MAG: hypothetical protein CSB55_03890 [Candidatus Cloacimonadota bacterium]|nr:MAG: hypothetical protein CSB55_03890 [Candidatus Cloacimonadota bacterium]